MELLHTTVHAPRAAVWAGVGLMALIGAIHLLYAPGYLAIAAYLGILFYATGAGSAFVTLGLVRGAPTWGWMLGMLLAAGAFAGYVASRTVGLPMFPAQPWDDPFGLAALVAEAIFVLLGWLVLRGAPAVRDTFTPSLARPVRISRSVRR